MNDMRKLMEAVETINEGWDPKGIADAIWLEYSGDPKSLFRLKVDQSPEPFRAMVYNFGSMTGLYNAETLDGSEIYHAIVDELERLSAGPGYDDNEPLTGEAVEEETVNYSVANTDAEMAITLVARALAKDAVEQAGGVWDDEGDGTGKFKTGARTRDEYVNIAARKFLSPDYKRDIIHALTVDFDEAVEDELDNYNKRI